MSGLSALGPRESLRGQVVHALRAALITGQMSPGTVYSAPVLAEQFGVSATPVREAMLDLVKEGLVEAVPNRGFRVIELSARDLDQLTEVRALVEVPAVAALAGQVTPAQAAGLRAVAAEIESAAVAGDLLAYIDGDRRFHHELLTLTGNAHLVRVVMDLRNRARLYGLGKLADSGELPASAQEHARLLDLLLAGDRAGVEELMRHHLGHIRADWAGSQQAP
jgi:DNA-binding GntR family transcriptional regulator